MTFYKLAFLDEPTSDKSTSSSSSTCTTSTSTIKREEKERLRHSDSEQALESRLVMDGRQELIIADG